jgi:EmrB/QacA subfamily drug resistance transporter
MIENVKHKGLALAILAAAQFMVVLDVTIVNVALPAIQRTLDFKTEAELQWVVTAYALAFGGFLLLGGRLADLFGRRKMFLIGAITFALASLAGGFAQDPTQIIVFRALQGLGGALLSPAALSLVLTIFRDGPDRNKALGVWSMVAAGGGAVGLLLGGVLTQYVDWRWVFFINVPIAALVVFMAMRFVPASLPRDREPVDFLGAVTVTGSLMSLVYALAKAAELGWGSRTTLISLTVSVVLMAWFIVNEMRVKHPLIRLNIFRQRNVTGGSLVMLLMPAAMFGLFFYLSIYLQHILHYSPTKTGLANLPFTFTIMVVAAFLSKKASSLNPKIVLIIGPLLAMTGLLYFSRVPINAHYWTDIFPGIVIMAAGMASVFVTATLAATNGVAQQETGLVSGLLNTGQQIGGAIGLAVLTVISTSATRNYMNDIPFIYASDIPEGLVYGFHHGFVAAAGFALAASLVALLVFKVRVTPTASDMEAEANRLRRNEAEAFPAVPGA